MQIKYGSVQRSSINHLLRHIRAAIMLESCVFHQPPHCCEPKSHHLPVHLCAYGIFIIHNCAASISISHMAPNVRRTRSVLPAACCCCCCSPPPTATLASSLLSPAHLSNPGWAHGGPCFKYAQGGRGRLKMTGVISEAIRRTAPAAGQ